MQVGHHHRSAISRHRLLVDHLIGCEIFAAILASGSLGEKAHHQCEQADTFTSECVMRRRLKFREAGGLGSIG